MGEPPTAICRKTPSFLRLKLNGAPPFKVHYLHSAPIRNGQSKILEKEEMIEKSEPLNGSSYTDIILDTSLTGNHSYTFDGIADVNYKKFQVPQGTWIYSQYVHSFPSASFLHAKEKIFHCLSKEETVLPIRLTGSSPFKLHIMKTFNNVKEDSYNLTVDAVNSTLKSSEIIYNLSIYDMPDTGLYTYTILSVVDSSGCASELKETNSNNEAIITNAAVRVVDQAKILPNETPWFCVGDIISYSLQGTPPFTIEYRWNNNQRELLIVNDPIVTFFAAEPGIIVIQKICNSMKCCQDVKNVTNVVYGLPTAIVDGGKDVIDDIRQGIYLDFNCFVEM